MTPFKQDFIKTLEAHRRDVHMFLDHWLNDESQTRPEETQSLLKAMRYGILNPGKGFRAFLTIESTVLAGETAEIARPVAAALECVHCYSLIHDDLPAIDNDDLRRGKPTVHREFDEATAILAGNALLSFAFEIISDPIKTKIPAQSRIDLVLALARATGFGGMIGGQWLDLKTQSKHATEEKILKLESMKTGSLISFACEAGAIIANASPSNRERMKKFGMMIGLAFQIADDLLDIKSTSTKTGKATGKDAAAGKATLISIEGAEQAQNRLYNLIEQAKTLLTPYGEAGVLMKEAADFIVHSTSG